MTLRNDLDTPNKRLRDARKRAGFRNATEAADALKVKRTTYRTHENGDRAILPDAAALYSEKFGISPAWLLYGIDDTSAEHRIRVVVMVGHGAEVRMQAGNETIPAPPGMTATAQAVRVVGDALHPRYDDGDLLFFGKAVPYEAAAGRWCIVALADVSGTPSGERLVRRVGPVAQRGEVVLESSNHPTVTRRLASYHPIDWVRPS